MKLKQLRNIIFAIFAFVVMIGITSCSCRRKYYEGEICGTASAEGDNVFSQVRRYYVEQWVYEYNLSLVKEGNDYADFAQVYQDKKYTINDSNALVEVEA